MYFRSNYFPEPAWNTVMWRFMPFWKYKSLMSSHSLFMSKLADLEDQNEGYVPHRLRDALVQNARLRWEIRGNADEDNIVEKEVEIRIEAARQATFVSCWHMNEEESLDMWGQYSKPEDTVAIKTHFTSFKQSLVCPERVHIAQIDYINHDHDSPRMNHYYDRFRWKGLCYKWEREIRALSMGDHADEFLQGDDSKYRGKDGLLHRVNLSDLIHQIVVSPYATQTFTQKVTNIAVNSGLSSRVAKSAFADLRST